MIRTWLLLLLVLVSLPAFSDTLAAPASRVSVEMRAGKPWTVLDGRLEATTDLSVARLAAVITDWAAYPRLFPKIRKIEVAGDAGAPLLTETTVVSVLGFSVTNRFTIKIAFRGSAETSLTVAWSQAGTDGTIDTVEGSWELVPVTDSGKSVTLVRYRTLSSVPQNVPGQDGLVGLFFPGELKQIVSAVLAEARQRKEKP